MSLHVALTHRTSYAYDRPVTLAPQVVRLRPAPHCRTPILAYALKITPEPHFINWQQDPFGNFLARVMVPERDARVQRQRRSRRRHGGDQSVRLLRRGGGREVAVRSTTPSCSSELKPYLEPLGQMQLTDRYVKGLDIAAKGTVDFVTDLNRKLSRDIAYRIRMEPGVQTPDETLQIASGSCRDFRLAAGADPAPAGPRRALRVGLPDPAAARREAAGRAGRRLAGFHRPARLGGGLHPRRRLDRARPDLGPARRRGAHPAGGDAEPDQRGSHHGRAHACRGAVRLRHAADPHPGDAARHQALHRAAVERDRSRPARRSTPG